MMSNFDLTSPILLFSYNYFVFLVMMPLFFVIFASKSAMGGSDYKQSTPSNSGKRHQGLKTSTYRRWKNQLQQRLTKWESIGLLPNSSWLVMQYQIVWRVTLSLYGFSRCQDARIQGYSFSAVQTTLVLSAECLLSILPPSLPLN